MPGKDNDTGSNFLIVLKVDSIKMKTDGNGEQKLSGKE